MDRGSNLLRSRGGAALTASALALLAGACTHDWEAFDFDGPAPVACAGQPGSLVVDEARAARLRSGLVVHLWADMPAPTADTGAVAPGLPEPAVLTRLSAEGARHLRLVYSARHLFDPDRPGALPEAAFAILARSIDVVHAAGLAAVLAPSFDPEFKQRLAREDGALEALRAHWRALGGALGGRDPQTLFLALIDGPGLPQPSVWSVRAEALLTGLRESLPGRLLLVPAAEPASPTDGPGPPLAELAPVPALAGVVYEQSLFAPVAFTHQGLVLPGRPELARLRELQYPVDRANLARVRAGTEDPALLASLADYEQRAWDAARVEEQVRALRGLAEERCVSLQISGLGVSKLAPKAARRAWLRDLRRYLDKYRVGWSAEAFAGPFELDAELRAILLE